MEAIGRHAAARKGKMTSLATILTKTINGSVAEKLALLCQTIDHAYTTIDQIVPEQDSFYNRHDDGNLIGCCGVCAAYVDIYGAGSLERQSDFIGWAALVFNLPDDVIVGFTNGFDGNEYDGGNEPTGHYHLGWNAGTAMAKRWF
jgi:hypothetical protein